MLPDNMVYFISADEVSCASDTGPSALGSSSFDFNCLELNSDGKLGKLTFGVGDSSDL